MLDKVESTNSIKVNEADEIKNDESIEKVSSHIVFTKKLLNAESTHFSAERPKY